MHLFFFVFAEQGKCLTHMRSWAECSFFFAFAEQGNCLTHMLAALNPAAVHVEECFNTLQVRAALH